MNTSSPLDFGMFVVNVEAATLPHAENEAICVRHVFAL